MHTRYLAELVGQVEPISGLLVGRYPKRFDFEYQVAKHVELMAGQWPKRDRRELEGEIRLALAVGQAWLHYDSRYDGGGIEAPVADAGEVPAVWTQGELFAV